LNPAGGIESGMPDRASDLVFRDEVLGIRIPVPIPERPDQHTDGVELAPGPGRPDGPNACAAGAGLAAASIGASLAL
jgi:hypothetical protein